MITEIELTARGWSNEFQEGTVESLFISPDEVVSIEFLDDETYSICIHVNVIDEEGELAIQAVVEIDKDSSFTIDELETLRSLLQSTV